MTAPRTPAPQAEALHAGFLAILPRIERHGEVYFRGVRRADRKEDLIAEMVALSWLWFLRLARRGKDASRFPSAIATYAARAVKSGRRVTGTEKGKDVLSPLAQQRRGFAVGTLPDFSTMNGNPLDEALQDNTQSPVPDQVAFRCDFPEWLGTLGTRNRGIAQDMALGHRTQELADAYELSEARISQLRGQFRDDWRRFTGESTAPVKAPTSGVV